MKKIITGGLAAAAVAMGLVTAGPANADSTNLKYEHDLKAAGFYADNGDGTFLSLGHSSCARMDAGASSALLVRELYQNSDLSRDQAQQFVNITISDLCPWNH
jgi:hypothetical protein